MRTASWSAPNAAGPKPWKPITPSAGNFGAATASASSGGTAAADSRAGAGAGAAPAAGSVSSVWVQPASASAADRYSSRTSRFMQMFLGKGAGRSLAHAPSTARERAATASARWREVLLQPGPAGLVVTLAMRSVQRLDGRAEHRPGLEHEGHGVG